MINGKAHGSQRATTTCQLHMRSFKSNDTIVTGSSSDIGESTALRRAELGAHVVVNSATAVDAGKKYAMANRGANVAR
jgi:NAD(P)-dependent dehydrogenase (short-subunit alcohol dehydrogenase family)